MEKKWIYKEVPNIELVKKLSNKLKLNLLISSLLVQRGINNFEKVKSFFKPSLKNLYNPFLLKDMNISIDRILYALKNNEKILIYGDYDVDGTTGITVLYNFLKRFSSNIYYYSPDRYTEGYGLSKIGIRWAKNNNINLIISVDCGIREIENAEIIKEKNIDLIISDHHEPGEKLPNALAVINPKRNDCNYPFDGLSGCGVAFKIIQAIAQKKNIDKHIVYANLDLVAVSIAADIVPIIDENRILAYYGLRVLQYNPRPGLKVFLNGFDSSKISISNLVFNIAPKINAAGRIDHAKLAIQLLLSDNLETSHSLLKQINENNETRKFIDLSITQEALKLIETEEECRNATVLYKNDWHKGVIGIVASRCIEKYYRPTIILTESNGKAVGSARSIEGYNIYEAINECRDLLEKYGGHACAAGLTLDLSLVEKFKKKFNAVVKQSINQDLLVPKIKIDLEITFKDINWKLLNILNYMAPFGPFNLNPIFYSKNLVIVDYKILKEKHLKIFIRDSSNIEFEAIGFGKAYLAKIIKKNKFYMMAYKIEENIFNGKKNILLRFEDLKIQ